MKIGKGKLLTDGSVSVPITVNGITRRVQAQSSTKSLKVAIKDKELELLIDGGSTWRARQFKDWPKVEATPEEMAQIRAEFERCATDPEQQARVAQSEKNLAAGHAKARLKAAMVKVKRCLKELIRTGHDTDELEQAMVSLVRETIVEAVQES
jgi:hypothetical protein